MGGDHPWPGYQDTQQVTLLKNQGREFLGVAEMARRMPQNNQQTLWDQPARNVLEGKDFVTNLLCQQDKFLTGRHLL